MVSNKTLSLLGVLALVSTVIIIFFWIQAPSYLKVNVSMDRSEAIATAVEQSRAFPLLSGHTKHAVMYTFDSTFLNYIELKAGGQTAFQSIIDEKIIAPYYWAVRIFEENTLAEGKFYYWPNGEPDGFRLIIPEEHEDASLSKEVALRLVNETVNDCWKGDFSDYELIKSSSKTQSNNRVDHFFVYEHFKKDMGEARVRLNVKVTGTQVSEVVPFTYVPKTFIQEYKSTQSSNTTITVVAFVVAIGLYLLLIGVPSLIILKRKGWLKYVKTSLLVAGIITLCMILSEVNTLPIYLFGYDAESSLSQFMLQQSGFWISVGLVDFIICAITFVLAESLTRRAFPDHIRLWSTWSRDIASSRHVLNNTIATYLIMLCDIAFVVLFYAIAQKYFGFWISCDASDILGLNYLATVCPWYTVFEASLHAGFLEEMLFRAVPLSVGLLLGRHFKRPILGLSLAMLVQIVIFGAGHASYPSIPSYARLVELIVPSLIYGFIYLRLGLVFVVITHYLYNVVVLSVPIFLSSGYIFDKAMILFVAMIPLGVVLVQRCRTKQWHSLKDTAFNRSFQPSLK